MSIANKPQPRGGDFSPWISDSRPGILTRSDDFKSGEISGLVHGVGLTGSTRYIVEQWLLVKGSMESPHQGMKLTGFPGFLPLAEKDTDEAGRLVWGFGRYPLGYPARTMDAGEFYEWAVSTIAPRENPVIYTLGLAVCRRGLPPDRLEGGIDHRPIGLETGGYGETFTFTGGCRYSTFAEAELSPRSSAASWPALARFERSRRFVQAYDAKGCAGEWKTSTGTSTASTAAVSRKTYREWRTIVEGWAGADVSYTDGTVLIDDNFAGEPIDFQDLRNKVAPLLEPQQ